MLELDPSSAAARLGLARCAFPRRRFRAALDEAMASIGLIYHQPLAHYLCGVALARLGHPAEAEAAFQRAVHQNSVFPQAHLQLARLYERALNDPDRAEQHCELARQARQRIEEFKAGMPSPKQPQAASTPSADVATLGDSGLGDFGRGRPTQLRPLAPSEIVIVSGLPRSGTSMMMQMLSAGGLPVLTDGVRLPDQSNPRGYLEFDAAKRLASDHRWLAQAEGKAVKIVAQLLTSLPQDRAYRILFMERPLSEVVASQSKMLAGESRGVENEEVSTRLARTFHLQIDRARRMLAQYADRVSVLSVSYHDTLADPAETARRANQFLGGTLNESAMAAVVDSALRHEQDMSSISSPKFRSERG
jgi:tetratricopeptide (TPR) repeat protein